jgi:hypothetical protein
VDANFWIRRSALLAQLLPLKQGAGRASGVTLREAVKYLEPAEREAILAAAGRANR